MRTRVRRHPCLRRVWKTRHTIDDFPNYRTTRLSESRAQLAWLCRAIGLKAKSIIEFFSVEHEYCEWHESIVRRKQKKDAALSGRSFFGGDISPRALPWADRCCPFRAMVCASFRRIAGRMPAYPCGWRWRLGCLGLRLCG